MFILIEFLMSMFLSDGHIALGVDSFFALRKEHPLCVDPSLH